MSKPITKALHTARVFRVLSTEIRGSHGFVGDAEALYAAVLELLGNADTTDAVLRAALIEACQS